jgi:hypothetical protein
MAPAMVIPIGLILLILLLVWVFGYGGPYTFGPLGLILLVLIILWLVGALDGSTTTTTR